MFIKFMVQIVILTNKRCI